MSEDFTISPQQNMLIQCKVFDQYVVLQILRLSNNTLHYFACYFQLPLIRLAKSKKKSSENIIHSYERIQCVIYDNSSKEVLL